VGSSEALCVDEGTAVWTAAIGDSLHIYMSRSGWM
jgi:hypothetical protein